MAEIVVFIIFMPALVSMGFLAYYCIRWWFYKREKKYSAVDHAKDFLGIFAAALPKLLDHQEKKLLRGIVFSMASLMIYLALVMLLSASKSQ